MPSLLRNVAALIAAIAILQLSGGLLAVRIPLAFADQSRTALGLVAAAYSAGFMMGAMIATMLFARVGHIRVYAACAAVFAVATLALHFADGVWAWGLARMAAGVAVALMFAAIEKLAFFLDHQSRARGGDERLYGADQGRAGAWPLSFLRLRARCA
ncbi:MAG: MFS transporter [Terricaulis sp.]|nr:MFS transporter [Terricaulis sp.]